jgi:flagellar protein FlbT
MVLSYLLSLMRKKRVQLSQVLVDPDSRALLAQASRALIEGQHYAVLRALRGLLPREERLLAARSR